jgi:hypothetical protein
MSEGGSSCPIRRADQRTVWIGAKLLHFVHNGRRVNNSLSLSLSLCVDKLFFFSGDLSHSTFLILFSALLVVFCNLQLSILVFCEVCGCVWQEG